MEVALAVEGHAETSPERFERAGIGVRVQGGTIAEAGFGIGLERDLIAQRPRRSCRRGSGPGRVRS